MNLFDLNLNIIVENKMLNIDLGKKIRSLRVENKMTQGFVAGELNMSQSAYSRMERRETSAWIGKIDSICKLFRVSLQELL